MNTEPIDKYLSQQDREVAMDERRPNAIVVSTESRYLSPAATIQEALARYALVNEFTSRVLKEGHDFGKIPGTDKPTLLKPGAEKLSSLFGLAPMFDIAEKDLDWTGERHGGEPFFYFQYRCSMYSGGRIVAQGLGSCNSYEKKYRYRNADRTCPTCGKAAIFKSKQKPEFYCWAKRGGCGATFPLTDIRITGQEIGQVKNPDPADIVNTIDKMAQKRALIAATLIATNASEYFTQDLEDFPGGEVVEAQFTNATQSQTTSATNQAVSNGIKPNGHTETVHPTFQRLIDEKLVENPFEAGKVASLLKLKLDKPDEAIRLVRIYRGWRDIGSEPKQAAEQTLAGKIPE
jgi:hypothetical protein